MRRTGEFEKRASNRRDRRQHSRLREKPGTRTTRTCVDDAAASRRRSHGLCVAHSTLHRSLGRGLGSPPSALPDGAVPFDMFGVEFSHHADHCTFETLCSVFAIHDEAVKRVGEIVHDLDLKDDRSVLRRRQQSPP